MQRKTRWPWGFTRYFPHEDSIALSSFASDHRAKHFYTSKASTKQADKYPLGKKNTLIDSGPNLDARRIDFLLYGKVPVCFCALLVLLAQNTGFTQFLLMRMHFLKKNGS